MTYFSFPGLDRPLDKLAVSKTIGKEIEKIMNCVSNITKVSVARIFDKGNKREVVDARHIAIFLIRKRVHMGYSHLGRVFGGRDHTTMIYACNKISDLIYIDDHVKATIKRVEDMLCR